jgi:hypothetical protein
MIAKKADRWIVLSLVAALAAETLLLLWHLGFFPGVSSAASHRRGPAGIVFKNENELRRRSADSLVWEKSLADESVFYFDSLLTLSQSTAVLKLEHEAEIELNENTLVTIEPPEENARGEIRLKFVRGNLRARNPWSEARIDAPEFAIDVKAGSEMQLRETGDGEYEIQVAKGEAKVLGEDGEHTVDGSSLLRMKRGAGAERLAIDRGLRWRDPPAKRIYFHGEAGRTRVSWEGEASELRVQKAGAPEKVIALESGRREAELELDAGDHLIYLRKSGGTSAALPVQIWKAPLLHLISPLPRDRVRTGDDISFLWMRTKGVASYGFVLQGKRAKIEARPEINLHRLRFEDEDDARWSVWGKDADGFEIPPLYEYPIFIRHKPFAAPQLNSPRLRKPAAEKGALHKILNLILPEAQADEADVYEAYFSWQAVEGADEYWLEISETPDFRNPVLSRRTSKTEFVWREFRDKIYYWRVAAGAKSGRMGIFSAPAKVSVQEGVELKKIETVAAAPASPPPPEAPKPAEVPPKELTARSEPALQKPHGWRLMWKPAYAVLQSKEERNVRANFTGPKAAAFAVEKDLFVYDRRWWTLEGKYESAVYKPKSKSEYPFQNEVKTEDVELRFTRVKESGLWGLGVNLGLHPRIERAGPERVRAVTHALGGVHARTRMNFLGAEYQGDFGLNAGSGDYGFGSSHRLLIHAWHDRMLLGIGTEALYLLRGSYNTFSADGFLTLGLEF